jgi:hypothetical protein
VTNLEGVDCTGALCAFAEFVSNLPGFLFERHRYIQALASCSYEICHGFSKAFGVDQYRLIDKVLTCLLGKQTVDKRRLAVLDGVAHHGIAICPVRCSHPSRNQPAARLAK